MGHLYHGYAKLSEGNGPPTSSPSIDSVGGVQNMSVDPLINVTDSYDWGYSTYIHIIYYIYIILEIEYGNFKNNSLKWIYIYIYIYTHIDSSTFYLLQDDYMYEIV